ncbi:MAG: hypothetical protein SPG61_05945 [Arcanobacterium sp.]|nr:hypothetical protein [Arcanobacterium sp.]
MKIPDTSLLAGLSKASVEDPIINKGITGNASNNPIASNATIAKVTARLDKDLLERARAAYLAGKLAGIGFTSFSNFIECAIGEMVQRLEADLNNGQAYAPVSAGILSPGRNF